MSTKETRRRRDDDLAAISLAAGKSITEAAEIARFSTQTLARRMATPAFQAKIEAARSAMIDRATGTVCGHITAAADKLAVLLNDESPAIQLKAANSLIDTVIRLRDLVAIERRLTQLEERWRAHGDTITVGVGRVLSADGAADESAGGASAEGLARLLEGSLAAHDGESVR